MYFTQFSTDSFLFGLQEAQLIKFIWEAICFREADHLVKRLRMVIVIIILVMMDGARARLTGN